MPQNITAEAIGLSDGRAVPLHNIKSLQISASLDSPARSLSGVFAAERLPAELSRITVRDRGAVIFEGNVDSQRSVIQGSGRLLHIEARTKGALLLDNQATPRILTNINLSIAFSLFLRPYGFILVNPQLHRLLSSYTVRAGICEWEAFAECARRMHGITPYMEGEQVMVSRPASHTAVRISNTGRGLRFTRLEHRFVPYNMLSEVLIRGADGVYNTAVRNHSAGHFNVRRRRYITPHNEFMETPSQDAHRRIRRSMLDSRQVLVTLPGWADLPIGQQVEIVDSSMQLHNLLIRDAHSVMDESGIFTKLVLVSSIHL